MIRDTIWATNWIIWHFSTPVTWCVIVIIVIITTLSTSASRHLSIQTLASITFINWKYISMSVLYTVKIAISWTTSWSNENTTAAIHTSGIIQLSILAKAASTAGDIQTKSVVLNSITIPSNNYDT